MSLRAINISDAILENMTVGEEVLAEFGEYTEWLYKVMLADRYSGPDGLHGPYSVLEREVQEAARLLNHPAIGTAKSITGDLTASEPTNRGTIVNFLSYSKKQLDAIQWVTRVASEEFPDDKCSEVQEVFETARANSDVLEVQELEYLYGPIH